MRIKKLNDYFHDQSMRALTCARAHLYIYIIYPDLDLDLNTKHMTYHVQLAGQDTRLFCSYIRNSSQQMTFRIGSPFSDSELLLSLSHIIMHILCNIII